MEDLDYNLFIRKINENLNLDLGNYKETQMKRRLTSLFMKRGFSSFLPYFNALMKDKELMNEFMDRVTINVSEFWRNPTRWTVLEQKFIPEMLKKSPQLKCWSAACSSGEEPYTLAMLLMEAGADRPEILAMDIDDTVLAKAQKGEYIERSIRDIPAKYLSKYFTKVNDTYQVDQSLKKLIRFKKGNLLLDRFEKDFDLIICRNVMIYFTEEAKQDLYHKFSQSLKPDGLLFVGSTEQIFTPVQYHLEAVDSFFYRKITV
ncbi:MAG: protein-glutamate O-methyltransferase CheR [Paenibacillaceae bacterium]